MYIKLYIQTCGNTNLAKSQERR